MLRTKEELQEHRNMTRLLKIKLMRLFAEHFEKEHNQNRNMASSDFEVMEKRGNAEQGSYLYLRVFHYGIENYYGKEIADVVAELEKLGVLR